MYEDFFGLRERPFDLTPNPRYLCLTARHREALSNLNYAIASRKGITLLLGEAGTGKTTLIRTALAARAAPGTLIATVHNPTLTRPEFVNLLAVRFGLDRRAAESKAVFLDELESLLVQRRRERHITGLIIDEAQSLPDELLEEVRLLANIETDDEKLLPVILVGQPELAPRLNAVAFRQLKQRISLRCELVPLNMAETTDYIACRLRIAGGVPAGVFTRQAVDLVHEASRGIPRVVNTICDNALVNGFAAGERPVTRKVIEAVCADFDLPLRQDAPSPEIQFGREPASGTGAVAQTVPSAERPAETAAGQSRDSYLGWISIRRRLLSFFEGT